MAKSRWAALTALLLVTGVLTSITPSAVAAGAVGPPVFGTRTATTAISGGSGTGGAPQGPERCPAGSVMTTATGLQSQGTGGWLTGVSLSCRAVQVVSGQVTLGSLTAAGAITGNRPSPLPLDTACPSDSVVTGFQGRSGALVDEVQVICTQLLADGTFGGASVGAVAGGSGGGPVGPFTCPAGAVATGLVGRAGQDLDTVALECQSLTFQLPQPDNASWPTARLLAPNDSVDDTLATSGQQLWYKVPVQPGSRLQIDLTNLPADYDLAVFKDIGQACNSLTSTADLTKLSAEFAGDAFSPSEVSPSVFTPSVFTPSVFTPSVFTPSVFTPSVFTPSVFTPSVFTPSVFTPSVFTPSVFTPSVFTPAVDVPSVFTPSVFTPSVFTPSVFTQAFSSAQTRSLIAVSANDGTAPESVSAATWNNTGYFYLRVDGRNGASSPQPFHVAVTTSGGPCTGLTLDPHAGDPTITGAPGPTTLILTDPARMAGTATDKQALATTLATFAGQVGGVVVNVSGSAKVSALNAQADGAARSCPYAKNLVAQAIRDIVNSYRGSLKYVVIVGNDNVIPFFRYPDTAGLGPEANYVPPVADSSASQASLRSNDILGQDAYGAVTDVSVKGTTLPVPDLAVGRLVETPAEITATLQHYIGRSGAPIRPASTLATGYDFLSDAADGVAADLAAGVPGGRNDTLITDGDVAPSVTTVNGTPDRRHSWTAADLSRAFLNTRHDIAFVAGHFSANSTLAADYTTSLLTTDLAAAPAANFTDTLVFSAGCHSGYNIVDTDGVPGVTVGLDWAEAFAQKNATLIAGTGYQYGDTDFVAYGEKLYGLFAHGLRYGTGPVAVGPALVRAKADYLSGLGSVTGIDMKTVLESTLYGLPMQSVDLPGGRIPQPTDTTLVSPQPVSTQPGSTLGLQTATLTLNPSLTSHTKDLASSDGGTVTATYLSGPDGVLTRPGEPTLPLLSADVTSPSGQVLRGIGFRSGDYTDTDGVTPLIDVPTTEVSGAHNPFVSPAFYPNRLAAPNYFDALAGGGTGATTLSVTPVQHRSDGSAGMTDTQRTYSSLGLSLFYSSDIARYGNNVPALAAPPSITGVTSAVVGGQVIVEARVVGDPSAGIQQVWLTYTGERGNPFHGRWASVDLTQDAGDSTLWTGRISLGDPSDAAGLRFLVQAANGEGLVGVDDNQGLYYAPTVVPSVALATQASTTLGLGDLPAGGAYGTSIPVTATLSSSGAPVSGRVVTFALGGSVVAAATDANGVAATSLPLTSDPGTYSLTAAFDGDVSFLPSAAHSASVAISKQTTALTLSAGAAAGNGASATLTAAGSPLREKSVLFVSRRGSTVVGAASAITGRDGVARVPASALATGDFTVTAYFGTAQTPLPSGATADLSDIDYGPSSSGSLRSAQIGALLLLPTVIGATYNAPLQVTGTPTPQVTATGLPPGLAATQSGSSWAITGATSKVGWYRVTVTAANGVGSPVTATYILVVGYRLPAFAAPLNDPPGSTPSVFRTDSTVPLRFQLTDAAGTPIPQAEAAAIGSSTRAVITVVQVGTTKATANETKVAASPQTGTAFSYDAGTGQFVYFANAATWHWQAGKTYLVTASVTSPAGDLVGLHALLIGFAKS